MRRLAAILLLLALASAVGSLHTGLSEIRASYPSEFRSYYIPQSAYLKVASLGQRNLWADLIFLWGVQYFDRYGKDVRTAYLFHTFDVLTDLDPRFYEAYIFGFLFLSLDQGWEELYRLADKGLSANPQNWLLAWDAGTYAFFQARDYDRAARYFQIAHDRNPGDALVQDMLANAYKYRGDYEASRAFWLRIRDQFEGDDSFRGRFYRMAAERNLFDLHIKIDLRRLEGAVARYREERGTLPPRLLDLVRAGYLPALPSDPDGDPYLYDPATGKVSCSKPFHYKGKYGQW
ncbi:MAG: hypothetical protein ACP5VN_01800 [Acidobacteriota bacterium]